MRRGRLPTTLLGLWNQIWFEPAAPVGTIMARWILAVHALWFLLSRPDLPELASWPPEMLAGVPSGFRLRFLAILPESVERSLYVVAIVLLVMILVGIGRRILLFATAILLYHLAVFEELIATAPHMYFGGFTLPVLGFFILSFARQPRRDDQPSFEWKWPLAMIQSMLLVNYFAAGVAKLGYSGWEWFTAENIRNWMLTRSTFGVAPAALYVAERPVLCWTIAIATAIIELGAPLFILNQWTRLTFAVLAFAGHLGIYFSMGILFPSILLLAILVPWETLATFTRFGGAVRAADEPSATATANVSRTTATE